MSLPDVVRVLRAAFQLARLFCAKHQSWFRTNYPLDISIFLLNSCTFKIRSHFEKKILVSDPPRLRIIWLTDNKNATLKQSSQTHRLLTAAVAKAISNRAADAHAPDNPNQTQEGKRISQSITRTGSWQRDPECDGLWHVVCVQRAPKAHRTVVETPTARHQRWETRSQKVSWWDCSWVFSLSMRSVLARISVMTSHSKIMKVATTVQTQFILTTLIKPSNFVHLICVFRIFEISIFNCVFYSSSSQ